jgi:hypothetical protein
MPLARVAQLWLFTHAPLDALTYRTAPAERRQRTREQVLELRPHGIRRARGPLTETFSHAGGERFRAAFGNIPADYLAERRHAEAGTNCRHYSKATSSYECFSPRNFSAVEQPQCYRTPLYGRANSSLISKHQPIGVEGRE